MEQDGGVRMKLTALPKPPGVGVIGAPQSLVRPPPSVLDRAVAEITGKKSAKVVKPIGDRRNPSFPNGFQPGSIRALFVSATDDTPSDTFPGIYVNQQLSALNNIENRELVEIGFGAADQCRALGIANETCFLCGLSLKDYRLPFGTPTSIGYPQCEHLLPAAAALLVFGVVDSTEEAKSFGETYKQNYAYAHSICNREKGSRLFVSMVPSQYTAEGSPILIDNIRKYLDDLYNFNPPIHATVPDKDAWITTQTENIKNIYKPLSVALGTSGGIGLLRGVGKYFQNIDYLYAKVIAKVVRNKQDYAGRVATLGTLTSIGKGRKTFRRRNNGISRRSNKHAHRKTSKSHRKRRA